MLENLLIKLNSFRDEKMPGYLPSEIIESRSKNQEELRATLCQRCYFIKEYNIALKVISYFKCILNKVYLTCTLYSDTFYAFF